MESYDFTARVNKILTETPGRPCKQVHKCSICNDDGRIQYFKFINKMKYVYYCHCTCEIGQSFAYEGRYFKYKSNYRMPSIEEIFPAQTIKEIIKKNKAKRHRIHEKRTTLENQLTWHNLITEG